MKTPCFRTSLAALAGGLAALLVSASAAATPNFPPEVEKHLMLSYMPGCPLCHQGAPGLTTVTTPFGLSIKAAGLNNHPNDLGALDAALDKLSADMTDSDGDGTPDIQELVAGTDPNMKGGGDVGGAQTISYGCFNQVAGGASTPGLAAALTALALGLAVRRRRRA